MKRISELMMRNWSIARGNLTCVLHLCVSVKTVDCEFPQCSWVVFADPVQEVADIMTVDFFGGNQLLKKNPDVGVGKMSEIKARIVNCTTHLIGHFGIIPNI